jgi:hypothetical protein
MWKSVEAFRPHRWARIIKERKNKVRIFNNLWGKMKCMGYSSKFSTYGQVSYVIICAIFIVNIWRDLYSVGSQGLQPHHWCAAMVKQVIGIFSVWWQKVEQSKLFCILQQRSNVKRSAKTPFFQHNCSQQITNWNFIWLFNLIITCVSAIRPCR